MKHFCKFLLSAVFFGLLISSCDLEYVSLEPEARQAWIKHPLSEIIKTYGAPTRETDDGLGGKIVVYESRETTVETNTISAYPGPAYYYDGLYGFYYHMADPFPSSRITTSERVDYAHFYIDSKGICYDVQTNLERPLSKHEKLARQNKKNQKDK